MRRAARPADAAQPPIAEIRNLRRYKIAGTGFFVSIPPDMVEWLGLKAGQPLRVAVSADGKSIIVRPASE